MVHGGLRPRARPHEWAARFALRSLDPRRIHTSQCMEEGAMQMLHRARWKIGYGVEGYITNFLQLDSEPGMPLERERRRREALEEVEWVLSRRRR